jgi:branched-subunit amino acid ABC-type transport system permease component
MVYGIIKLINFAHGDIYMIGAYIGYACIRYFNLGLFLLLWKIFPEQEEERVPLKVHP